MKNVNDINFTDGVILEFCAAEFCNRNSNEKSRLRTSRFVFFLTCCAFMRLFIVETLLASNCSAWRFYSFWIIPSIVITFCLSKAIQSYLPGKAKIIIDRNGCEDNEQFNDEILEYCSIIEYKGNFNFEKYKQSKQLFYRMLERRFTNTASICLGVIIGILMICVGITHPDLMIANPEYR